MLNFASECVCEYLSGRERVYFGAEFVLVRGSDYLRVEGGDLEMSWT